VSVVSSEEGIEHGEERHGDTERRRNGDIAECELRDLGIKGLRD
jgi:hypothetical protein